MLGVRILGTGRVLSGREKTTAEVAAEAMPDRDAADLVARTGIDTRYWLDEGATTAELGTAALGGALEAAGRPASDLRRIILVTSTGGDWLIPANANAIAEQLGLAGGCDCFDVNNACTGFLTGFDIAARSVATGLEPVAVVVVETLSRYLSRERPRPYVVLGDAAAACVIGADETGGGVVASHFGNLGAWRGSVSMRHPQMTGETPRIVFESTNAELAGLATEALARSARLTLAEAGLEMNEIDWVVPHQPNGRMLDKIVEHLGVAPECLVRVVHEIGSVGAASVPVSLDRLMRERPVEAGHHVLMLGVGAGMAYGAILLRIGS